MPLVYNPQTLMALFSSTIYNILSLSINNLQPKYGPNLQSTKKVHPPLFHTQKRTPHSPYSGLRCLVSAEINWTNWKQWIELSASFCGNVVAAFNCLIPLSLLVTFLIEEVDSWKFSSLNLLNDKIEHRLKLATPFCHPVLCSILGGTQESPPP